MLTDFWKGLGGKLAERWLVALFSPAFAFWLGAVATWLYAHGWRLVSQHGWLGALQIWTADVRGLPVVVQVVLVLAPLILIILSGLLLQRMSRPALRILEGYWPPVLARLRERCRKRISDRADHSAERLRVLLARPSADLTGAEIAELSRRLDAYRRIPPVPRQRTPTRLGNVLRTSELRPGSRYGLDAVICWPRLWLLMPDASRQEVADGRAALYLSVQVWLCGLGFSVFAAWAWWAPVLGVAVAAITYYTRMLSAARVYGELLETCYDIHRGLLYDALRWPRPGNPQEEYTSGKQISAYLSSGSRRSTPHFTDPP